MGVRIERRTHRAGRHDQHQAAGRARERQSHFALSGMDDAHGIALSSGTLRFSIPALFNDDTAPCPTHHASIAEKSLRPETSFASTAGKRRSARTFHRRPLRHRHPSLHPQHSLHQRKGRVEAADASLLSSSSSASPQASECASSGSRSKNRRRRQRTMASPSPCPTDTTACSRLQGRRRGSIEAMLPDGWWSHSVR